MSGGLQRVWEDFGLQVCDVLDQLVHPLLGAGQEHRHWNLGGLKEEMRIWVDEREREYRRLLLIVVTQPLSSVFIRALLESHSRDKVLLLIHARNYN